jgi:hypothetical protein
MIMIGASTVADLEPSYGRAALVVTWRPSPTKEPVQ